MKDMNLNFLNINNLYLKSSILIHKQASMVRVKLIINQ